MTVVLRPGTAADSPIVFALMETTVADLAQRHGYSYSLSAADRQHWERRRPLYEHLARTADQWWIAEADGEPIGYARSILRDGVRELTEFFVRPDRQSAGIGRELLARAFPRAGERHRCIIATSDARALARYLKAGVYPRFPIFNFRRAPQAASVTTDLEFVPMADYPDYPAALADLDQRILGHQRVGDHAWLQQVRAGYLYVRHGRAVGYGYEGPDNGPFALLAPADYPAVLAHAEAAAHQRGEMDMGFEVPLVNRAAVDYLLAHGYQMDRFFAFFMSDEPFGQLDHYVVFSPPFFL